MTGTRLLLASFGFCFIAAALVAQMRPTPAVNPAFEQLKSLAGEWVGKESSGVAVKSTYQVVSAGSAVMERLQPTGEPEMVTMYTVDGDRIVVTHSCSAGNQPTMQTAPLSNPTGKLDFSFVCVAGTTSPDEGHMVGLSLDLTSKDHLTQVWTYLDHGKSHAETFTFTRKS